MPHVTLLYAPDCPNWPAIETLLTRLADETELEVEIERREVASIEEAQRLGVPGSPTVRIDGRDPFDSTGEASLSCRLYATDEGLRGVPAAEDLRRALREAGSERVR